MADQSSIDALTAQIQTLNDAIAGGEKQTVINGESVTYRSIAEMMTARADMQFRLNLLNAQEGHTRHPSRRTLLSYSGRDYNTGFGNGYFRR